MLRRLDAAGIEGIDEAIERAEKVVAESKADMTDAERAVVARQVGT